MIAIEKGYFKDHGIKVVIEDLDSSIDALAVVAQNRLASALVGDYSAASGRERNIAWRHFTGDDSRLVRTDAERAEAEEEIVADLRDAAGRYSADEQLGSLLADLRAASPRFAELWEQHPVARRTASRKTFDHPEVGRITLDCDVLAVQGGDLRLVVYTAAPGSSDGEALELLNAIGIQSFAG